MLLNNSLGRRLIAILVIVILFAAAGPVGAVTNNDLEAVQDKAEENREKIREGDADKERLRDNIREADTQLNTTQNDLQGLEGQLAQTRAERALLIFVSLVLITNTIRLAIFARRKEIGIMRLVGASSWFVRWPFLLEGMIEGLIGAGIAIIALTVVWRTLFANLASGQVLAFMAFPFDEVAFVQLIVVLLFSGAIIGGLGSIIALRRFLRI